MTTQLPSNKQIKPAIELMKAFVAEDQSSYGIAAQVLIDAVLAAYEQEPYGYVHQAIYESTGSCALTNDHEAYRGTNGSHIPLYTHPAPSVLKLPPKLENNREEANELNAGVDVWNKCIDTVIELNDRHDIKFSVPSPTTGLHPDTQKLVADFSAVLAEKLYKAQLKYGYSDGWKSDGWADDCLKHFQQHVDKGDPRDVAAYCAFMWFHGWSTALPAPSIPVPPVAQPVMFIDGDISSEDAEKLAKVIREFNEEDERPLAKMARIIRENPHPTNECDMLKNKPAPSIPAVPDEISTTDAIRIMNGRVITMSVHTAYKNGWNACRDAMLQGAEPDFREISNSSTNNCRENAEMSTKCWCLTCRPVTISDMRFVVCPECGNKRCPHANDHRNACTGSNEPGQEGSAYPAAPQQEVK